MTATLPQQHDWQRLHPLSAVVRGGKVTLALAVVLVPSVVLGRENASHGLYDLAAVAVVTVLAFISWLVTRWRLDGDDLQIETGLIRRHSERYPLSQLQAIDIVRPGLARMVGVAELRLRMGGSTGAHARLAYLLRARGGAAARAAAGTRGAGAARRAARSGGGGFRRGASARRAADAQVDRLDPDQRRGHHRHAGRSRADRDGRGLDQGGDHGDQRRRRLDPRCGPGGLVAVQPGLSLLGVRDAATG